MLGKINPGEGYFQPLHNIMHDVQATLDGVNGERRKRESPDSVS